MSSRLPPELRREFVQFCKSQLRPASEVLREAVKRYMQTEELRRLRQKIRRNAEAQSFVSDEDFFRAVS
ncbi:MAG: hypothetical protein AAFO89_01345 [Planctomycetota bacterium]